MDTDKEFKNIKNRYASLFAASTEEPQATIMDGTKVVDDVNKLAEKIARIGKYPEEAELLTALSDKISNTIAPTPSVEETTSFKI